MSYIHPRSASDRRGSGRPVRLRGCVRSKGSCDRGCLPSPRPAIAAPVFLARPAVRPCLDPPPPPIRWVRPLVQHAPLYIHLSHRSFSDCSYREFYCQLIFCLMELMLLLLGLNIVVVVDLDTVSTELLLCIPQLHNKLTTLVLTDYHRK